MTAERWARITSVFHAALERPAGERAAFLDEACGGDQRLRRNVEVLLAGAAAPSLSSPAPEFLDKALELSPGDTLAQYRVEAKIGEGGMGTVYRGYDTRLLRTVALKVLPPERFADLDRKRRLLREARAASALNHPNIVTIYEVGSDGDVDFIAMECVQGKSLDELIPPEGLAPERVLRYAVQIADALARAHGAGILHRDLKPSNVMVTEEGCVKLLDFGLAKAMESGAPDGSPPDDPAAAFWELSAEGSIAGTAAYMSPEQAEGRKLDARSDIFSFGSVLYEMAIGRRPFTAESRLALLSSIVNEDPRPPGELGALPADLEKVILRCLQKDPTRRYQTAADLKAALEDLETEAAAPRAQPSMTAALEAGASRRTRIRKFALLAGAIAAAVVMILVASRMSLRPPEAAAPRTVKFAITPANLRRGGDTEIDAEVSISRDGKHIAYVESEGVGQLWIRDIDEEQARPVPGATGVYQAFWSPDNQYIGYSAGRGCGIRGGCDLVRVPVRGGAPIPITRLTGPFRRAWWSSDGKTILYCDTTGMYTVPVNGGPATRILEHPHIEHPSLLDLPGGRRAFLYQAVDRPPNHAIYVQAAGEDRRRLLVVTSSSNPYPAYSPSGHIVYVDGSGDSVAIWALPFSLATLEPTGKPFRIAQRGSSPQVSATGTLVYSDVPSDRRQLAWVDRSGKQLALIGEPQRQSAPLLSPDGRRLAVEIRDGDTDLWMYDLDRGTRSRLTSDADLERLGSWTASGDRITFSSMREGNIDIVSRPINGRGEASRLVATPLNEVGPDWSPDQRFLIYVALSKETKGDLLYRERRSDGSLGEPVAFLKTPLNETAPRFSPDGRFVAYASDESGRNEIYVREFPSGAGKLQISVEGGTAPRWRRDGKEIFYVELASLMAVSVTTQPAFSAGPPARLFDKRSLASMNAQYDVSADGKRFVTLEKPPGEPPLSIHVVHNWFEEFRGRQP